jgi:hypothetical protein
MLSRARAYAAVSLLVVFLCGCMGGFASDAADDYARARSAARRHDLAAAYMHFRPVAASDSSNREPALFAVGEYHFLQHMDVDAVKSFTAFCRNYPDSRYLVFAFWYLKLLAERLGQAELSRQYQEHIVMMRQHSFLFRKSKEWSVLSPLSRKLRIVYYIDKVEFYADGKLSAVIAY